MTHVAIIDYGVGNLRSVEKAFTANGCEAVVSSDYDVLNEAERLVLPGVGAFAACMKALSERGFDELVQRRAAAGTPLLGVCVGMQMLFAESEEFGQAPGLGLLPGRVRAFKEEDLPVPHVGWNQVRQARAHPLLAGISDQAFFYFVHSFFCEAVDDVVLGETEYGSTFASIVGRGNVCGVQFHPEKSQNDGLQLLKNFANKGD